MSENNPSQWQGPPTPPQQQWYGQPGAGVDRTNTNALIGFILSLGSFFILGVVLAIPGLILSRKGQAEIASTGERGEGLAKAGVILGWISIGLSILAILAFILILILGLATSGAVAHQGDITSSCIAHAQDAACQNG
jgi:hypothetical protein